MKIVNYEFPHSSFLSVEKDMEIITNKFFKNDRLKKLLYYNTKDCLNKPKLTEEQTLSLINKQIKMLNLYTDLINYLNDQINQSIITDEVIIKYVNGINDYNSKTKNQQFYIRNKDKFKQYYEANKDAIREKNRLRYHDNKNVVDDDNNVVMVYKDVLNAFSDKDKKTLEELRVSIDELNNVPNIGTSEGDGDE